jgi:hypothetical protein
MTSPLGHSPGRRSLSKPDQAWPASQLAINLAADPGPVSNHPVPGGRCHPPAHLELPSLRLEAQELYSFLRHEEDNQPETDYQPHSCARHLTCSHGCHSRLSRLRLSDPYLRSTSSTMLTPTAGRDTHSDNTPGGRFPQPSFDSAPPVFDMVIVGRNGGTGRLAGEGPGNRPCLATDRRPFHGI